MDEPNIVPDIDTDQLYRYAICINLLIDGPRLQYTNEMPTEPPQSLS